MFNLKKFKLKKFKLLILIVLNFYVINIVIYLESLFSFYIKNLNIKFKYINRDEIVKIYSIFNAHTLYPTLRDYQKPLPSKFKLWNWKNKILFNYFKLSILNNY